MELASGNPFPPNHCWSGQEKVPSLAESRRELSLWTWTEKLELKAFLHSPPYGAAALLEQFVESQFWDSVVTPLTPLTLVTRWQRESASSKRVGCCSAFRLEQFQCPGGLPSDIPELSPDVGIDFETCSLAMA